ncbi:MAG: DNA polymerase III subunit delta [Parcubacteria group bacterium]|jgi:DNA polymerase III delta subunit
MLIYICGEETYTTHHKVEELKSAYIQKNVGGGNCVVFDCDEKCDVYEICRTIGAQDLFASEKMIIIKNFIQSTKAEEQKIMQKAISGTDIIVFWETGLPRKNAFLVGWLNKNADEVLEGKKLVGHDLTMWITQYAKKCNAKIDRETVDELVLYVGNDLWRLAQEIDKLSAYVSGRVIAVEDVHVLVHGQIDADMFATIEAIVARDKGHALTLLKKQLAKGDDPFHIFSMYTYQIRTLLLVGGASQWGVVQDRNVVAKLAGVHPFVAQKALLLVKKVSQKVLTNAHKHLTVLDREIKTGKRDVQSALDLFVMGI